MLNGSIINDTKRHI